MTDDSRSSSLEREELLNHDLVLRRPGRRFVPVEGSRWGELIQPSTTEMAEGSGGGLRLVLFASFEFGYLMLQAAKAYSERFPGRLQLVAVVTDDPVNPTARIGLKKRVWKYLGAAEQLAMETAVADSALSAGAQVYTGEVKTVGFRALLDEWKPDAIASCVFGQVIDAAIINRPAYGIYNLHPSDLAHGHGAGLAPDLDLASRGATSTVWTIHQVAETVDTGPVVSSSLPINVSDPSGCLPENHLLIYDKLLEPVGCIAVCLVDALSKQFKTGKPGRLETLDLRPAIPPAMRARMLEPIRTNRHDDQLPTFDPCVLSHYELW
jgi:folate-dependent phosphoribosylglycinamide formyltransferase PurN